MARIEEELGIIKDGVSPAKGRQLKLHGTSNDRDHGNNKERDSLDDSKQKGERVLKKLIPDLQDLGWFAWNPSLPGQDSVFELASVPPKEDGDEYEWQMENPTLYKIMVDVNQAEIKACLQKAEEYEEEPMVAFVVATQEKAAQVAALAKQESYKKWSVVVPPDEGAPKKVVE